MVRCWLALHPSLPASGPALSTRLCRIRQLGVVRPPVRTTRSPGSDRDSSVSSITAVSGDYGRPGGNTRSTTLSVGVAAVSGSIWDESSLSSLDFSPQRQDLPGTVTQDGASGDISSSDGGLSTEPGPANAEARGVGDSAPWWTHRMQDGEELNGTLSEESEEESPSCRPGGDWTSPSLEADDL